MKKINLNIEKLRFNKNGIYTFYSSKSNSQVEKFQAKMIDELLTFSAKYKPNTELSDCLNICAIYIARECSALFSYILEFKLAKSKGIRIYNDNPKSNIYKICKKKKLHHTQNYILKNLNYKKNLIVDYLRIFKFLINSKLNYLPPNLLTKEDILIFHYQSEMNTIAKKFNKKLNLCKLNQFFNLAFEINNELNKKKLLFISEVSSLIKILFKQKKVTLESEFQSAIDVFIDKIISQTLNLINSLEKNKRHIPDLSILGSPGLLPYRILSYIAKKNNKKVIILDHGCGSGWLDLPLFYYEELYFSDNFFTFSKKQCEILKEKYKENLKDKKIYYVKKTTQNFNESRSNGFLFICSHLREDKITAPMLVDDFTCIDFQIRFIDQLNRIGPVTLKPHPKYNAILKNQISNALDIKIENKPFEKIFMNYKYLIFDNYTTSCIVPALQSSKSIIIFDYYNDRINQNAKNLLLNRVGYHKIIYDSNKRPILSKNLALKLIKESDKKKKNNDFYELFF